MGWKRCTTPGAFAAITVGFAMSCVFYGASHLHAHPEFDGHVARWIIGHLPNMPFLNRVGWVFWISLLTCVAVSLLTVETRTEGVAHLAKINFKTSRTFNIASIGVLILLTLIYVVFW
jgi:SSS family solute:Na+ symporter